MFRTVSNRLCNVLRISQNSLNETLLPGQTLSACQNLRHYNKCINSVQLLGTVSNDAQFRGEPINRATFQLTTTKAIRKKSGELAALRTKHNIVVWNRYMSLLEKCSTIKSADRVYVTGTIDSSRYLDANNEFKYYTTISADNVIQLEKDEDFDEFEDLERSYSRRKEQKEEDEEMSDNVNEENTEQQRERE